MLTKKENNVLLNYLHKLIQVGIDSSSIYYSESAKIHQIIFLDEYVNEAIEEVMAYIISDSIKHYDMEHEKPFINIIPMSKEFLESENYPLASAVFNKFVAQDELQIPKNTKNKCQYFPDSFSIQEGRNNLKRSIITENTFTRNPELDIKIKAPKKLDYIQQTAYNIMELGYDSAA